MGYRMAFDGFCLEKHMRNIPNLVLECGLVQYQIVLDRTGAVRPVAQAKLFTRNGVPVTLQTMFSGDLIVASTKVGTLIKYCVKRWHSVDGVEKYEYVDGEDATCIIDGLSKSAKHFLEGFATGGMLPASVGWNGRDTPAGTMRKRLVEEVLTGVDVSQIEELSSLAVIGYNNDLPKRNAGEFPTVFNYDYAKVYSYDVINHEQEIVWLVITTDGRSYFSTAKEGDSVPDEAAKLVKFFIRPYILNQHPVGIKWEIYRRGGDDES